MSASTGRDETIYGTVPIQLLPGEKIFVWPDPAGPLIEVATEEFARLAARVKEGEA